MPIDKVKNWLMNLYIEQTALRGIETIIDTDTQSHIFAAANWLVDDNGKFGLALLGLYGNGKTTLMKSICRLINEYYYSELSSERKSIRLIDAKEIVRIGSDEKTYNEYRDLVNREFLAIDDIGEEPAEVMKYGMIHTPVKDLLMDRYKLQKVTIITSNLSNDKNNPQFQKYYGERIADRMREMAKVIVFRNASYRGKF